ncbi:hypothetical protein FD755_016120 [Muntiacus reevesi]|uniref:Peptide chain release factor domain-containing protein n=1 Tax=Muntiacus reevesi TaxID=9886 RepID=A0A5N3XDW1_MUNRE|nr:hypothetical protein FD755_016120 [Muntiacus reevesi]
MRSPLLWNVFRGFWARQDVVPARGHLSCGNLPLEELFACGGPLPTFLKRQAAYENGDLRKLAENEITSCEKEIAQLKHQIILLLVPSEETDKNDLILEVTAGVGDQEAMLFPSEIFDMYQQYAAFKRWHFETLEYFPSDIGGLRHASASIAGSGAYKHMKFVGGVHRVQRRPRAEKKTNLVINPKDLRIDTNAVQIIHLPTGIVSKCQQERSQLKNKEMAMRQLCAKLYSLQLEEETRRSEKIRTYNFPQNRVTDHRINKSLHDLETFMQGEYLLDELVQSLKDCANYESLVEIISKKV